MTVELITLIYKHRGEVLSGISAANEGLHIIRNILSLPTEVVSSAKFGVSGVPTFVFVKDGKVQETISGEYPEEELRKKLDALL